MISGFVSEIEIASYSMKKDSRLFICCAL